MQNVRIIPRLDIKGPNVVKGVQCEGIRVVGSPKEFAARYYADGADELLYMDIVASLYQRNFDFDLLKSVADAIFIPITAGGGIRSIHDINNALRAGADKVAINTYAIQNPKFLAEAVKKFGSQCIVISIEAKRVGNQKWEAYTDGGREKTGVDAVEWAKKALEMGVGEILITSIDKDGTKGGYDSELIKAIASFSPVPVVAHGGAGNMGHILDIIQQCGPNAVAAASIFHYGEISIKALKQFLSSRDVSVRIL